MTKNRITQNLIIALITVFLSAGVVYAGAGSEASSGEDSVTSVTYANFSSAGGNEEYLTEMKAAFEEQHPNIQIEIETYGYNDYFTQLQTRIAGGDAPDAYELNYENFVSYANRNLLLNLGPYLSDSSIDLTQLQPNARDAFRTGGTQYGLPGSFSTVLLFYNQELFDRAGVGYPSNDWTWDDAEAAAQKIRDLDDQTFGLLQPVHFWEFYKVVRQFGGALMNEDQTAFSVDRPENVRALERMVARVRESNIQPSQTQLAGMGEWDIFRAGRLGMLVTGIWAFPDFTETVEFPWDVAVEPGMDQKATHFFANGMVVSNNSDVPEAAATWVAFLAASREVAEIRVDAGWELPPSTYPEVLQTYVASTPPENRQAVFESLNHIVTPPVVTDFARMADIVNLELEAARDGSKTALQALRDAQEQLEAEIEL